MRLAKYKQNLRVIGCEVYSYETHVASIDHQKRQVQIYGYWSKTTSKHINYVANELGYEVVRVERDVVKQIMNMMSQPTQHG